MQASRRSVAVRGAGEVASAWAAEPDEGDFYLAVVSRTKFFRRRLKKLAGEEENLQTTSGESSLDSVAPHFFPFPWSAYVRLLSVKNTRVREFYETEALRGGWSVRQLDRQINSQFYNSPRCRRIRPYDF